jgi:hypothetical protein
MKMRIATLALVLIVTSCQGAENRFAKRPVSANELIGTWIGTDYSMKSLREVGVRDHLNPQEHVLVIRADGTCSIRTTFGLPPRSYNPAVYRSYDHGCSWQLEPWKAAYRHHQRLRLTLPDPDRYADLNLDDEKGQLLIWQYATDPDAWLYLEFARSSSRG